MSDESFEVVWGGDLDTDHLGKVLEEMGKALQSEGGGIGLQSADYTEHAGHDEFGTAELTIAYAGGLDGIAGDPIRHKQNHMGE